MKNLIYTYCLFITFACSPSQPNNLEVDKTKKTDHVNETKKDQTTEESKVTKMYDLLESMPKDLPIYNNFNFFVNHIVVNGKIDDDSIQKYKYIYIHCMTHLQQNIKSNIGGAYNELNK